MRTACVQNVAPRPLGHCGRPRAQPARRDAPLIIPGHPRKPPSIGGVLRNPPAAVAAAGEAQEAAINLRREVGLMFRPSSPPRPSLQT